MRRGLLLVIAVLGALMLAGGASAAGRTLNVTTQFDTDANATLGRKVKRTSGCLAPGSTKIGKGC